MRILAELLSSRPDDQHARWLLNVAAMTLGKYPDGVPARWRVPPELLRAEFDIRPFPNIASLVGLNILGLAGGAVVDDLDGDGNLDIMISGQGLADPLRVFHNNGDATFTERTREARLQGITGGLNLIHADYDNDGDVDVFVLRGAWMGAAGRFPCSLLRSNGDGSFTDVTRQAGLMRAGPTQTAVWLDYDCDGRLDLFVGFESDGKNNFPCALYRNLGDGTFLDVAPAAGIAHQAFVKSVVSADYNNDGWPDIFLSAQGRNALYRNNGNGTFTDATADAGVALPVRSFGSFFFDFDNDGWSDLFVFDYNISDTTGPIADLLRLPARAEHCRLYRNRGDGRFEDITRGARIDRVLLAMGHNFGDLDNDGWLDFYAGTGNPDLNMLVPNRMFRNEGGRRFQDVTTSGNFGHLQKGHGIGFADLNNDGEQDVFAEMGGAFTGDTAYSALYANPGHGNGWITLRLEGAQSNRSAIGARIHLTVRTGGASRSIHRTVGPGGSFGCNPFRQEIGIGKAESIERAEIYWPAARRWQTVTGLIPGRFYRIREGSAGPEPLPLRSAPWPMVRPHNTSARAAASR